MSGVIPPEPNLIVASEIFGRSFRLADRREVWSSCNLKRTLGLVSRILAHLDYSMLTNGWQAFERKWAAGAPGQEGAEIRRRLAVGHYALAPFSMVQCVKEIVMYADPVGGGDLGSLDFIKCVLGINEQVDSDAVSESGAWPELRDEFTLFAIAETSGTHAATIATLCADAGDIWYRRWAPTTDPGLLVDIGDGPADMFKEATGISIDDFFALGMLIYRNFETNSGDSSVSPTIFEEAKVPEEVKLFFLENCTSTLGNLRAELLRGEDGDAINPWSRYVLQQRPFLILDDGSIIMLRLQYMLERFFGDHPYLQANWILSKIPEKKRTADHFAGAMRHLFEYRVGEVLQRISRSNSPRAGGIVLADPDFRTAWSIPNAKEEDEICDWGYYHENFALLIDANMRNLLQGLAEGTADISVLEKDFREKYKKKFSQLISTVEQFREKGWPDGRVSIDENTKFIPLVLAPDGGMVINPMTQLKILEIAMPMVAPLGGCSLPPGIISWRELLILEGEVEERAIDFIELLVDWRFSGSDGESLATSLQQFMEMQSGYAGKAPKYFEATMIECFERATQQGFSWRLRDLSESDRRREINRYQALTGKIWRK
ncbi:hypothetical protein [Nocardia niigatensis]|uniref:hypothetical protein n=1 Tax=Nocardia niigatensis TaxID=209249 RepID=UPI0012F62ED0|nr:hypothetical protein [Nocardia niigatensis]